MERNGVFVPEHQNDDAAVLLEQAQANSQALIVATVAFLGERGIPVEDWAAAIGKQFAKDWPDDDLFGPDEFLDAMLTNLTSFGARVVSADFASEQVSAVITNFPMAEVCEAYGVDPASVAKFHESAAVVARSQGLEWDWRLDGDRTRIVVRPSDD